MYYDSSRFHRIYCQSGPHFWRPSEIPQARSYCFPRVQRRANSQPGLRTAQRTDKFDISGSASTDVAEESSSSASKEAESWGTESNLEDVEPYSYTETSFENDEAWAEISISRPRQTAETPWVTGPIPEGVLLRNTTCPHGDQSDSNRRSNERREGDTEDIFEHKVSRMDETCEQGSVTPISWQNSENSESESVNAVENDEMDNGDEIVSES